MLTRRVFLLGGAGVAGALVIGWAFVPPRQRVGTSEPRKGSDGRYALNGWVKISPDNLVTVVMSKVEMGQGVHTGAAMLLAEEMEADWSQIRVEQAPLDNLYNNIEGVVANLPFRPDDVGITKQTLAWFTRKFVRERGLMFTGGSTSIQDLWMPMRQAGAAARMMLCAAAAKQWPDVEVADCRAEAGKVLGPRGSLTFGELAEAAAREPFPKNLELKAVTDYKLIGTRLQRVDTPEKVRGKGRFGIDVIEPDMVYASVKLCPTLGGQVKMPLPENGRVRKMPGVIKLVVVPKFNGGTGGVAVIAKNAWVAMEACNCVECDWDHGDANSVSSSDIRGTLEKALDESWPRKWYEHGDLGPAMKASKPALQVTYFAPYLAHAALEPLNCTVLVQKDHAIVWAASQVPDMARCHVAKALGLNRHQVEMRQQAIGGAFGRRLEVDFICQAAAIAKEQALPVQSIWTRPQDMQHDYYRPACVSRFEAWVDGTGGVVGVRNMSASQSLLESTAKRNFGMPGILASWLDKSTVEGAFDQPYDWPNVWVGHNTVHLPVPVGYWRSVGHSYHAFFMESFVDELAIAAKMDPIDYRMRLLKQERHRTVLDAVRQMSSWDGPLQPRAGAKNVGRGVALHESFGSVVAQVAEISVLGEDDLRVDRVFCAIDCGIPINPTLIEQQVEGGIVFGLSAALWQRITLSKGQVEQDYFSCFPVARMHDCPEIKVQVIPSTACPQGVGESTTPPIAPAVANAWFAATGRRKRDLPLLKLLPPTGGCDADNNPCQR